MICVVSPAPDIADVDIDAAADAVEDAIEAKDSEVAIDCVEADDCAAAKLTMTDTRKYFEKYIVAICVCYLMWRIVRRIISMRLLERVV